jgi:hypothetical protein
MVGRKDNTLVLTATIQPLSGIPQLRRISPADRLNDYARALSFYCNISEKIIPRIVFIENSNADLSELENVVSRASASDRVEFISFYGLDYPAGYGRGYGEFKLLDYGMEHSRTLASADPNTTFWKITGRYMILNIVRMIRDAPSSFDLYCDVRDWPMPWLDLRVFACTLKGYRTILQGVYPQLNESAINMAPEQYLHSVINELAKVHKIATKFQNEPFVDGVRGKDLKNYSSGINLLKFFFSAGKRMCNSFLK